MPKDLHVLLLDPLHLLGRGVGRRGAGRVGAGRAAVLAGGEHVRGEPVAAPEGAHVLAALAHEQLVLRDAHLLAVDDARALGPRAVPVLGVLLHVDLGQAGLLLVVGLLLRVRHRLPAGT